MTMFDSDSSFGILTFAKKFAQKSGIEQLELVGLKSTSIKPISTESASV